MKKILTYLIFILIWHISTYANDRIHGIVSAQSSVDPKITELNYANRSSGAYTDKEPVIVKFINNGNDPITSIKFYFQVNSTDEIVETFTPISPILSGETGEYTFEQKANLGIFLSSIQLKAGVRMENDVDLSNNEIKVTFTNIATDIPYTPDFVFIEDGIGIVDPLGWKNYKKSGSAYWGIEDEQEWFVDLSESSSNADTYLVTIPLWMVEGKTYDLKFDAYTDGLIGSIDQKNKMSVYITTDKTVSMDMNLLWDNNSIDGNNAKYTFVRYKATRSGMYYFAFHCKSPKTANILRLQNIYMREALNKDIGVVAITSPENEKYMYTNQEKVNVLIHNFGVTSLAAGQVEVNLQVDGRNIIKETVHLTIEANKSITYEFNKLVDMSDVNIVHQISAWTTLAGDLSISNDSAFSEKESIVAGIPYTPDMGTARIMSNETNKWSVADKNNDQFVFSPISDVDFDSFVFGYGGWRVGGNTIIVPSSDDELLSRPIKLETGFQYKLSYMNKVEKADSPIPLVINLYKMNGSERILVKELWSGNVTSTSYQERMHRVDITESGIYEFGFSVKYSEPLSYMIKLGQFSVNQIYDKNLTLERILIPSTQISCYNSFPVGVMVKNNGKKPISSFVLKANSLATGKMEKKIMGISLASDDSYTVYFDNNLTFDGTEDEFLTMSVLTDGDLYEEDNQDSIYISYVPSAKIPSSLNLGMRYDGWTAINNNHDEYGFEFAQMKGFVYDTNGNDPQSGDDLLMSNCFPFKKDKIYSLEYNFSINKDTTSFSTYLLKGKERIDIVKVSKEPGVGSLKNTFKGFFSVPEDGDYPICMHISDKSHSLIFNGKFNIKEVAAKPDVEMIELILPIKDTLYSKNETIKATFKVISQDLSYVPFTCKIGDKTYSSRYLKSVFTNSIYTVEFPNVDLYTPGDYEIEVSADVSQDATPENNVLKKTITSLPILDVVVMSLDSPESGVLTRNEPIEISIKNEGKGILRNIPLKCVVSSEEGDYTKEFSGVVAGPIADGETVQYRFEGSVDLYQEGHYLFDVSAELSGDIKEENNQKQFSVLSSQKELDGGVVAILSPIDKVLGETETVSVQVKNYSTVDLYEIPIIAEIEYLENETPSIQNFSAKIKTIKSGETVDYIFDKTANMKALGRYSVKAYTTVKGDANSENDVCQKQVRAYTTDVGVTEVIDPQSGEELGSQSITIRVKNFGESMVEQVPVAYKVGAMPQLGIIKELIAPGESYVYTFPAKYDFMSYKTYTITAYTELEVDADKSNNNCTKEIENRTSGMGFATVGQFSIYPNPSNGTFTVSSSSAVLKSIVICTTQGVLLSRYDGLDVNTYQLCTDLREGSYLINVVTESGVLHSKLIIRK